MNGGGPSIRAGCPILTSCFSTLEPALSGVEGVGFHERVHFGIFSDLIHEAPAARQPLRFGSMDDHNLRLSHPCVARVGTTNLSLVGFEVRMLPRTMFLEPWLLAASCPSFTRDVRDGAASSVAMQGVGRPSPARII